MILSPALFIENCPSTNAILKQLIEDNTININELNDLFFLYTNYQNAGRGLADNHWESEKDMNILASFYFNPPILPKNQFLFNQFFSLTILNTISHFLPNAKIKWPNDIYIRNKKIAGILIEHSLTSTSIKYTIAGVGINVNQTKFSSSLPNPTSLCIETGKQHQLSRILNLIVQEGEKLLPYLYTEKKEPLNELYLAKLFNLDVWAEYAIFDKKITAKIIGTDPFGRLLLVDKYNNSYTCNLKEIKFLLS